MERITPENGVKAFFHLFGGSKKVHAALNAQGFTVPLVNVYGWVRVNALPETIYNLLNSLIAEETETFVDGGFVEVFFRNRPIGKFYLAKEVSLVVKKPKPIRRA